MGTPAWEWKWNINTVAILVMFIGGFVAWGYTLSTIQIGLANNEQKITDISARVSVNELALRRVDSHELRITSMEKTNDTMFSSVRTLEKTLGELASDVKVTKEILQRLEAAQRRP